MTRVDFYQLEDNSPKATLLVSCKLVQKALAAHGRVYLQTPDLNVAEQLDQLLWSFQNDAFIPHIVLPRQKEIEAPVAIGVGPAPDIFHQVLINLTDQIPDKFERFERVLELVPADEAERVKARTRFAYYKKRGYQLNYHQLSARQSN